MPPFGFRKRERSSSPAPKPNGRSSRTRGTKPTLFETADTPKGKQSSLEDNKKFLDMDSTLSSAYPSQHHSHLQSLPADGLHRHNGSTSTQNSESADSSPTTTLVTDTSSLSDPSPSSSPDSPINLIPLNSYPATTFGALPSNGHSVAMSNLTNLTIPDNYCVVTFQYHITYYKNCYYSIIINLGTKTVTI